jgi:hypothetical protein
MTKYKNWSKIIAQYKHTECSESSCALIKGGGSDVHERLYMYSKNSLKQLHTSTAVYNWIQWNNSTHFNGNFDTDNQIYAP